MSVQLVIIFLFLALNFLTLVVSVPLMRGRVRRNGIYGMRLPKTLSSDAIWYPANRFLGEEMFKAGLVSGVGNGLLVLIYPIFRLSIDQAASYAMLVTIAPLAWAFVKSLLFLRRL